MDERFAYTIIGSRETPPDACAALTEDARFFAQLGMVGRSGGAFGADKAGEAGMGDLKEIFLPKDHHVFSVRRANGEKIKDPPRHADGKMTFVPPPELKPLRRRIASDIHPNWSAVLRIPTADLSHERNTCQILGLRADRLSELVIFWAPERNGKVSGGTATAVALARACGVPTFNRANPDDVLDLDLIKASLHAGKSLDEVLQPYRDPAKAHAFAQKYDLQLRNPWIAARENAHTAVGANANALPAIEIVNVKTENKTGANLAPNDVYCGRAHKTRGFAESVLHNPYRVGTPGPHGNILGQGDAAGLFRVDLERKIADKDPTILAEGERLATIAQQHGSVRLLCFCAPGPCHTHAIRDLLVGPILERRRAAEQTRTPMTIQEAAAAAIERGTRLIAERTGKPGSVIPGTHIASGEVLGTIGQVAIVRDGSSTNFAIYNRADIAGDIAIGDRGTFERTRDGVRFTSQLQREAVAHER